MHAAEEPDGDDERGPAGGEVGLVGDEGDDEVGHRDEEGHRGDAEAHGLHDLHRQGGEGEQAVVGQADEFAEGVLGGAGVPRGAFVLDADLFVPDPGPQAADKAVALGEAEHVADDAPPHDAEVAGVERNLDGGHGTEEAVEGEVGETLEEPLLARLADAEGDVGAVIDGGEQQADRLGGVLQVAVDDGDEVSRGEFEAGGDGGLMPEVAGEQDALEERVLTHDVADDGGGVVAAAIVDEQHLGAGEACGFDVRADAAADLGERILLVVNGDEDGKAGALGGHGVGTGEMGRVGWIVAAKILGSLPGFRRTPSPAPRLRPADAAGEEPDRELRTDAARQPCTTTLIRT